MKIHNQLKIIARSIPENRMMCERQNPLPKKWVFFSEGLNEVPHGKIQSSRDNLCLKNPYGAVISASDGEKNILGTILPDTQTDEILAGLRSLTAKGEKDLKIDLIQQGQTPVRRQLAIKALYILRELNLLPKVRLHNKRQIGGVLYHMENGKLYQMEITDKNIFKPRTF